MKKMGTLKSLVALTIAISPIAITPLANADSSNPAMPQVNPSVDPYKALMDQFRIDRDQFMAAVRQRSLQIRAINNNFKIAIDGATSNFIKEMVSAKTPDQKNLAVANRKNSISSAIVARDLAIAALGAEPTPPVEPPKPLKAAKSKNR